MEEPAGRKERATSTLTTRDTIKGMPVREGGIVWWGLGARLSRVGRERFFRAKKLTKRRYRDRFGIELILL